MKWTELLVFLVWLWMQVLSDLPSWRNTYTSSRMEVWGGRGLFVFELALALVATAAFLFSWLR